MSKTKSSASEVIERQSSSHKEERGRGGEGRRGEER